MKIIKEGNISPKVKEVTCECCEAVLEISAEDLKLYSLDKGKYRYICPCCLTANNITKSDLPKGIIFEINRETAEKEEKDVLRNHLAMGQIFEAWVYFKKYIKDIPIEVVENMELVPRDFIAEIFETNYSGKMLQVLTLMDMIFSIRCL